jgi:uncharacterized tellurite resistance protein B-like protein
MPLLAILISALILTPLVAGGVLYFRFCQTPEKRWQNRVLGLRSLAQKRLQQEYQVVRQMSDKLQHEEKILTDRAFQTCLEHVAVERLDDYPGIGPATTNRLRQSGYTTLAYLQRTHIRIHGLGEKRLADIHQAVGELTRATWTRFREDSNCPEKVELEGRLQSMRRDFQEQEFVSRARCQGIEAILQKLHSVIAIAEQISFMGYLGLAKRTVVPADYFVAQLPSLEEHLHAIDATASKQWRERERTCVPAVSPIPVAATVANNQHIDPLELTIQFAFAVARADGRLAQAEKAHIERHIETRYRGDQALFNRATALCAHYAAARINVDDCLTRIKKEFAAPDRMALVNLACELTAASGGVNRREQEFLAKVSSVLQVPLPRSPPVPDRSVPAKPEMPPAPVEHAQLAPSAGPSDPRTVLEIDSGTVLTADLIRRHFNRLWERFEPDKMAAMGGDFVAMAQSRRAALRAAACTLIAPFGEELEPKTTAPSPRDIRENPDLDAVFGV